ncbi:MAG: hypothetical protein D6719_02405 [Candidatus Dadabacteria bacterium]|nr:MAG: hypothetical protein D6719_02405 [Candidatus Dadabacteria bacterium]
MQADREKIKAQILKALHHPEADEGLYFRNFVHLHEEDERIAVEGAKIDVLDALNELIREGKVVIDDNAEEVVFFASDVLNN